MQGDLWVTLLHLNITSPKDTQVPGLTLPLQLTITAQDDAFGASACRGTQA